MSRKNPLDESKYVQLLFLIMQGCNTNSNIIKQYSRINKKHSNGLETPSNLSMKLAYLKNKKIISNSSRSKKTSKYSLNYNRMVEYICNEWLKLNEDKLPKNITQNIYSDKRLHNTLKKYLFGVFASNKDTTLRSIFHNFIIGIALSKRQALMRKSRNASSIFPAACYYKYFFKQLDNKVFISEHLADKYL